MYYFKRYYHPIARVDALFVLALSTIDAWYERLLLISEKKRIYVRGGIRVKIFPIRLTFILRHIPVASGALHVFLPQQSRHARWNYTMYNQT